MTDLTRVDDELVVRHLQELVRFDTTNFRPGDARGERECVAWIADRLRMAGYQPTVLARDDAPHRANLVVRVPGLDRSLPAVMLQGHTDVVPAEAEQWSVDPFAGEIRDGFLYGRGAMDMKDTVASALALLEEWAARDLRPRRDVVFCFVADEETGGEYGAQWLVETHPELFEGVEAAIGEDGAMFLPLTAPDGRRVRLFQIACAERGVQQVRLTATGASGHGSRPTGDDALTRLIAALHRITTHRWPLRLTPVVTAQLQGVADALGMPLDVADEASILAVIDQMGEHAGALRHTIRASAVPTIIAAGYKVNVIPGRATAELDVRTPPGMVQEVDQTLRELIGPDVAWEYTTLGEPVEAGTEGPWFQAMREALLAADPQAVVVPYCMGGGTDAKAFASLGIRCYGFTPLPEAAAGVPANYHGVDERMPVEALVKGHAILGDFLLNV